MFNTRCSRSKSELLAFASLFAEAYVLAAFLERLCLKEWNNDSKGVVGGGMDTYLGLVE